MLFSYALCKYLTLLLKSHCHNLYQYLDPLDFKEVLNFNLTSKWNLKFVFPIMIFLITIFIGDFCLVFWSNDNFELTFDFLVRSPRSMIHQAFTRAMWPQLDVTYNIAAASSIASYLTFLRNPYNVDRYIPKVKGQANHYQGHLLSVGKHFLSAIDSKTITSFHKTFHKSAFTLFLALVAFVVGFSYVHVFYINNIYEVSFIELTFWLLLYPLMIFYLLYTLFAITLFIVMTIKLIQFRQKSLINRLNRLSRKIIVKKLQSTKVVTGGRHKCRNNRSKSIISNDSSYHPWLAYEQLNADLLKLCTHIEATSAFWSPLLTVYFASQILILCYFVYICFFIPKLLLVVKVLAIIFLPFLVLLFFAVINTCACVASLNVRFERANGRFCSQMAETTVWGNLFKRNCRFLVKVCN